MAFTSINNPELYFQCKLYTGNGSNDHAQTFDGEENMQPNMVWIKSRSAAENHHIFDSVRGANKRLIANDTSQEFDDSSNLQSFDSDGFTLGTADGINKNTATFVCWAWKESATAGFDIVAYTGSGSAHTISHSLSAVPSVVILKGRSFGDGWGQYHKTSGNPAILAFDGDVADRYSSKWSPFFNSTAPTSSVFSVGTDTAINTGSGTHIAYLFAEKQGFSKFGTYTGNGNASGSYIHLGFRPAMVIIKRSNAAVNWYMFDNKRDTFNVMSKELNCNNNGAEATELGSNPIDFLSNGFKLRVADSYINGTGDPYIYMAFAEQPFVNSNGIPANAR